MIPGLDEIRRFIPDFQPEHLHRWRVFHLESRLSEDGSCYQTNLKILAEYDSEWLVELCMCGVRELEFPDNCGCFYFGFSYLVIEDIRSWQWEGIRYRVTECEEDGKRFLCLCHSVAFTRLLIGQDFGSEQVVWEATNAHESSSQP